VENFNFVQRTMLFDIGFDGGARKCGVFFAIQVKLRACMNGLRRKISRAGMIANFVARTRPKYTPETRDPSGGTTGRVKPYGRLGWMGARAEYSLDGEG
jgi:hypothetical protein